MADSVQALQTEIPSTSDCLKQIIFLKFFNAALYLCETCLGFVLSDSSLSVIEGPNCFAIYSRYCSFFIF